MDNIIRNNHPTSYTIRFTGDNPELFNLYDENGKLFYFRKLGQKKNEIKINLPINGDFATDRNTPFEIIKSGPLEVSTLKKPLPLPDRNFTFDGLTIKEGKPEEMGNTPARIYPKLKLIEIHPKWYNYPAPIRLFIALHELGHLRYKSEESADLWALNEYLKLGYNMSMAYYALSEILHRNKANIARINSMFNNVMNYTGI